MQNLRRDKASETYRGNKTPQESSMIQFNIGKTYIRLNNNAVNKFSSCRALSQLTLMNGLSHRALDFLNRQNLLITIMYSRDQERFVEILL